MEHVGSGSHKGARSLVKKKKKGCSELVDITTKNPWLAFASNINVLWRRVRERKPNSYFFNNLCSIFCSLPSLEKVSYTMCSKMKKIRAD